MGGDIIPISEAQKRATMKYMKNNYDRVELKLPKGDKVIYQEHAASIGESLNAFTNRAMKETLERDAKKADED